MKETALTVSGMDCASCVAHVEKAVGRLPGVQQCQVNLARGRAVVQFDPKQLDEEKIATAITEEGYPATIEGETPSTEREDHSQAWLIRAIAGILLWFPVEITHWILYARHPGHHHGMTLDWIAFTTSTIAIVFVGGAFFRSAWGALKRRTSNMDTLISLGAGVAYLYSLVAFVGILRGAWEPVNLYFMESTGLLALISLGHYLEARARTAAGDAIHQLLNLTPPSAIRLKKKSLRDSWDTAVQEEVAVSNLNINDRILIRPGNRVPIDSIILEGQSSIDESMITGEPLPVPRCVGDEIIGGTINHDGALTARVTKVGSETALAQIIRMVEQAQASKPPVQKLADKIAAIFVPSVLVIALITGIAWYAVGSLNHWPQPVIWGRLANAVCSVLVIACPCALGLAIPAALMVGTGRGARKGILIRDISALQAAEKIDTIILDKTGTITRGKPVVSKIIPFGTVTSATVSENALLSLAASIEQLSEHPLARAIVDNARHHNLQLEKISDFRNDPGLGVTGKLADSTLLVGSAELLRQHSITPPEITDPGSIVYIARDNEPLGAILISDEIKPDSARAIADLHNMHLRTVLLTGDNQKNAEAIAKQIGIDDIRAQVKPGGKADVVKLFQTSNLTSALRPLPARVAMVGDGINDAPALAAADLGIAIGTGSDIAKETGDIVLVSGSLTGVPSAIHLSKATMRIIRQNLFFAFIYNVLAIPLAASGMLSPLIAAGAMALSDITVLGNSLRLRYIKLSK